MMVEQATLSVSIDASDATRGATEFSRAADDIKRKAADMGRTLDRGSQAFRNMRAAANDNSRALDTAARALDDATNAVNRLGRSENAIRSLNSALAEFEGAAGKASRAAGALNEQQLQALVDVLVELKDKLNECKEETSALSIVLDILGAAADLIGIGEFLKQFDSVKKAFAAIIRFVRPLWTALKGLGTALRAVGVIAAAAASALAPYAAIIAAVAGSAILLVREINKQRDAQREYNEALEESNRLFEEANGLTGEARRAKFAEAAASFENTLALRQERGAQLAEKERAKREIIESISPELTNNPFAQPDFLPMGRLDRNVLRGEQRDLKRILDERAAVDNEIAESVVRSLIAEREMGAQVTTVGSDVSAIRAGSSPRAPNDSDPVGQIIDDTTRSIELLNEQNRLLKAGDVAAAERKGTEAEIRERILQLDLQQGDQKALELEQLLLEQERLKQLNDSLRENAELRARTQEDTEQTEARAAALEDLAQKLRASGLSAEEMQFEVDLLNRALDAGIDLTKDYGQEWLAAQRRLHGAEQAIENVRKAEQRRQEAEGAAAEERRKRAQDAKDEEERRAAAVEASIEQIRNAAKDAFKDVIKGTESVGDAFKKLADRITDILLDLALEELLKGGTGFSDLFGAIFGGLGDIFGGASSLSGAATSAASLSRAGAAGAFTTFRPTGGAFGFHTGGIVGRDGMPRLTAANFNGAPRYHGGGMVGLAADEVPIIAQRGEEVLTRRDPRHRDNLGAGGGNVVVNVSFPNARNTDEARQAGSEIAAKAAAAAQRGMARKGLG